jgi:hypothetical protein
VDAIFVNKGVRHTPIATPQNSYQLLMFSVNMTSLHDSWGSPPEVKNNQYSSHFFVCPDSISNLMTNLNDGNNEVNENLFISTYEKMNENMDTPEYYPGLYIVRGVFSKEVRYKSWHLCVSRQNKFFLLPRGLKLTARTGWIYSISRNYSNGKKEATEKLFSKICEIVVKKMGNLGTGIWYSLDLIFDEVIQYLESNNLKPNRSQVITNNEWTSRYVISDNPMVTLQKIEIPDSNSGHPFPMDWMVEKFSQPNVWLPLLESVAHRPESLKATIIDILNSNQNDLRNNMFNGNPNLIDECLEEFGFEKSLLYNLLPDRKTKLFNLSLGYNTPRIPYHQHFSNISVNWDKEMLWGDLELRLSEVFDMWVESLVEINGYRGRKELMEQINQDMIERPFILKEPVDIGSVNLFVRYHLECMKNNQSYREKIKKRLPKRMYQLMTPQTRQMLEHLSIARNKMHAQPKEKEADVYDHDTHENWKNLLPDGGRTFQIRQALQTFYLNFYGIEGETNVSSVPTLMEVIEFSETHRGKRAILQCMRNGTIHNLSLSPGKYILTHMGKKKGKKSKLKLNLGDRMYVWATTNPTLVDPLIVKF